MTNISNRDLTHLKMLILSVKELILSVENMIISCETKLMNSMILVKTNSPYLNCP
jgi:hypothetical protein